MASSRWIWVRRIGVTGGAVAALPFLLPPTLEIPDLPLFLGGLIGAWKPLYVIAFSGSIILGLTLVWSRGERGGSDLAVFLVGSALCIGMFPQLAAAFENPELAPALDSVAPLAAWILACAGMMRFALTFPQPATIGDFQRVIQFGKDRDGTRHSWGVRGTWWLFEHAWPVGGSLAAAVLTAALLRSSEFFLVASLFAWAFTNFPMMLALALLPLLHWRGDGATRRQTLWVAVGVALGLIILPIVGMWGSVPVAYFLDLPSAIAFEDAGGLILPATSLGGVVFVACLAVALFRDGLFDPALAIRKTTVYGAVGIAFLFLFSAFGNVAESWLEGSLALPGGVGSALTGGSIAVLLIPVKRRMDGFMNRILPATVLAEAPTQIVAVLFSDIVGYTALTGADQKTGLTVMSVFHKAADRVARENRGRYVKAVADEVMLEFRDPSDAVRGASQLQEEFHEAAGKLDLPTPDICTGIHFGSVTRSSDGDLFGDTVNIASRVQGVAEPGQVVLSYAVEEKLKEGEFELQSLGAKELKNVSGAVECFGLSGR
ncbi:adenylate/guanylate cyclase domain-containing protein [Gemmatimonadota bacterium]